MSLRNSNYKSDLNRGTWALWVLLDEWQFNMARQFNWLPMCPKTIPSELWLHVFIWLNGGYDKSHYVCTFKPSRFHFFQLPSSQNASWVLIKRFQVLTPCQTVYRGLTPHLSEPRKKVVKLSSWFFIRRKGILKLFPIIKCICRIAWNGAYRWDTLWRETKAPLKLWISRQHFQWYVRRELLQADNFRKNNNAFPLFSRFVSSSPRYHSIKTGLVVGFVVLEWVILESINQIN